MKTLDDIRKRVQEHCDNPGDSMMIATCGGVHPLMYWLPESFKEGFEDSASPLTREAVLEEMKDYFEFALGKAFGERGISSERSIWKYTQWLWLLEDTEMLEFAEDNYPMYGKPILKKIAEKYGYKDAWNEACK